MSQLSVITRPPSRPKVTLREEARCAGGRIASHSQDDSASEERKFDFSSSGELLNKTTASFTQTDPTVMTEDKCFDPQLYLEGHCDSKKMRRRVILIAR